MPGVKKREIRERSWVWAGGSIRLIIGDGGWTRVNSCDEVVPSVVV